MPSAIKLILGDQDSGELAWGRGGNGNRESSCRWATRLRQSSGQRDVIELSIPPTPVVLSPASAAWCVCKGLASHLHLPAHRFACILSFICPSQPRLAFRSFDFHLFVFLSLSFPALVEPLPLLVTPRHVPLAHQTTTGPSTGLSLRPIDV
jgi:hypothetical protein